MHGVLLVIVTQAQLAEQEQKRLQVQAAKHAMHLAADSQPASASGATQQAGAPSANPLATTMPIAHMELAQQAVPQLASPQGSDEASGRKRRRGAVDYIALNRQLEAEAASSSGPQPAPLSFVTDTPPAAVGVHATSSVPNQRPDRVLDGTAVNVEQLNATVPRTHEGDKT